MSRRGHCYESAVMESWFATVTSEEGEPFHSYAHAKEVLFPFHTKPQIHQRWAVGAADAARACVMPAREERTRVRGPTRG